MQGQHRGFEFSARYPASFPGHLPVNMPPATFLSELRTILYHPAKHTQARRHWQPGVFHQNYNLADLESSQKSQGFTEDPEVQQIPR